jgi:hypothetical protein
MSIPQALLRDEIPRNEAYREVRRSASGPEGLRPGGTRDEGNAADGRFPTASLNKYFLEEHHGRGEIIAKETGSR